MTPDVVASAKRATTRSPAPVVVRVPALIVAVLDAAGPPLTPSSAPAPEYSTRNAPSGEVPDDCATVTTTLPAATPFAKKICAADAFPPAPHAQEELLTYGEVGVHVFPSESVTVMVTV